MQKLFQKLKNTVLKTWNNLKSYQKAIVFSFLLIFAFILSSGRVNYKISEKNSFETPIDFLEIFNSKTITAIEQAQIRHESEQYIAMLLQKSFEGIEDADCVITVIINNEYNLNNIEVDIVMAVRLYTTSEFSMDNVAIIADFLCENIVGLKSENLEIRNENNELIYPLDSLYP